MNTLEIVLLSLLAGLLIALLIAANAYLAWMLYSVRRTLITAISASADASRDISLLRSQIEGILNAHRQATETVVAKINGDRLVEASNVIIAAAKRIETACVAFGNLAQTMLSGESLEPELQRTARTGLGPESYAPNPTGERFFGQSRTASQDSRELLDESLENRQE